MLRSASLPLPKLMEILQQAENAREREAQATKITLLNKRIRETENDLETARRILERIPEGKDLEAEQRNEVLMEFLEALRSSLNLARQSLKPGDKIWVNRGEERVLHEVTEANVVNGNLQIVHKDPKSGTLKMEDAFPLLATTDDISLSRVFPEKLGELDGKPFYKLRFQLRHEKIVFRD